jgi:hypothetical protein
VFDPIAADLAVRAARASAGSARPHAPVVPDAEPRAPRAARTRRHLAADLRAVARWVEPRRHPGCQPG